MPLFPLDAVRNASIDRDIEPVLEDVREEILAFPWNLEGTGLAVGDIVEVYDLARPRLNVLAMLLRDLTGRTGADIGTGFGFLPVILARLGLQTYGTDRDVDSEYGQFARSSGIDVRRYAIGRTSPSFRPGSLDFLVFAEVLEHLKMPPIVVLRELTNLLRPGGRLLLTTPNIARLQHVESLIAGENFLEPFPEHLPPGADPTDHIEHVREYSIREVVEAAEAAGLAVDRVLMTGWGESGYHPLANPWVNEICVLDAHI